MPSEGGDDASQSPSFFRVLLSGFNKKLPLPRAFVKNLTKEKPSKKAILVNPTGKSWPVDVFKEKKKQDMNFGGDTWEHFVHAHKLGFGYFLVFFYRGNMVFAFRAYDLSTCEIVYPSLPPEKRKIAETKKQQAQDQDSNSSKRSRCRSLGFEAKMVKSNISESYMNIPIWFLRERSELASLEELTLEDPKGRAWHVRLHHRKMPQMSAPRTYIAEGWREFARGNRLKMDDRCVFELVVARGKGMAMNVRIIRQGTRPNNDTFPTCLSTDIAL